MTKERLAVISVDRDDDIGKKLGIKGPVIGKEKALKTATELIIADPEESDANAIFGAIKIFEELKDKYEAEIVVLTGHRNRGIEADREVSRQLDAFLEKNPSDFAVFVSDGRDDEYVLPVIQSRLPILSMKRIIVRQAEQLESGYYKLKDFLKETIENPKVARFIFGLPAIALLLFFFFGFEGYRIIIGALGVYLFIKGFKLEDYIHSGFGELKASLTTRKHSFFVYVVAILVTVIALYRGSIAVYPFILNNGDPFTIAATFLRETIYLLWIGLSLAWLGFNFGIKRKSPNRIASVPLFGIAVSLVVDNTSIYLLNPKTQLAEFMIPLAIGFIVAIVGVILEATAKD